MTGTVQRWGRWAWDAVQGADSTAAPAEMPVEELCAFGLAGLVHAALKTAGDPRHASLGPRAREVIAANLMRPLVLEPVLSAFDRAGIRAVLFKGAATTERFEILRGIRGVGDADLLVAPADFGRAREVLSGLGFSAEASSEPVSHWSNNERSFVRSDGGLEIDLHRGLHRWPLFTRLSEAVVTTSIQANHGWRPQLEMIPLIVAAHRAKHGYTADVRELLDVAVTFRAFEPSRFSALVGRSFELGVAGALYGLWTLVRSWFGPTSRAESAAYADLREQLGWRRPLVDALVALDGPADINKPWRRRAFLKLYAPQPLLTDRWLAPAALAAAHIALRGADRLVAGPMAVEPSSR